MVKSELKVICPKAEECIISYCRHKKKHIQNSYCIVHSGRAMEKYKCPSCIPVKPPKDVDGELEYILEELILKWLPKEAERTNHYGFTETITKIKNLLKS